MRCVWVAVSGEGLRARFSSLAMARHRKMKLSISVEVLRGRVGFCVRAREVGSGRLVEAEVMSRVAWAFVVAPPG